ncbi:hypothetical protein BHE74_00059386 [Ensete ventricosum]|nr:hypothetical protein BHE74_00059386 [Ensete ventricosum]
MPYMRPPKLVAHNNVNLFFYGPFRARRRISDKSTLGCWSLVSDIALEVSLPNEVFDLVLEVLTLLSIVCALDGSDSTFFCLTPQGAF